MSNHAPVIIIKKKKGGHAAHHGGAWKVAYADFVTAMMAFFLVMWLVNQPQDVGAGNGGQGADVESATAALERAAERIKAQIKAIPGFKNLQDQIEIKVTAEGLRIELQEGGQDTFFDSGSARVKDQTQQVLRVIAKELATLPQAIAVEGHTDAAPFGRDRAYTNWELSADRANAARRIMEGAGLPPTHVKAVRGFADTILRTPDAPFNPRNRRVSIVVQHSAVTARLTGRADTGAAAPREKTAAPATAAAHAAPAATGGHAAAGEPPATTAAH